MKNCGFCLVIPQSHGQQWGHTYPTPVLEQALEEVESSRPAHCSCRGVPLCPQVKSVRRRDKKASVLFIEGNMNPKGRGLVITLIVRAWAGVGNLCGPPD